MNGRFQKKLPLVEKLMAIHNCWERGKLDFSRDEPPGVIESQVITSKHVYVQSTLDGLNDGLCIHIHVHLPVYLYLYVSIH